MIRLFVSVEFVNFGSCHFLRPHALVVTILLPPIGYGDHHLRLNFPRPRNPTALPR